MPRLLLIAVLGACLIVPVAACSGDDNVVSTTGDAKTATTAVTGSTAAPATSGTGGGMPVTAEVMAVDVVGMDERAATARIEAAALTWRVVSRDGEELMVTQDYVNSRLGLTIVKGVVVAAKVG